MAGFDWPELRADPGGEPGFVLSRAELAVRRPEVRALALDLRLAIGLAAHLDAGSGRGPRGPRRRWPPPAAPSTPTTWPARPPPPGRALAPVLVERADAATNGHGPRARVTAVGHAHIDTAWLWPLRETVRKCARTFATAVTLMEDFPEYRFVCSAAQHLAWIEERYPELFARIAERVRTGQFVPGGRHVGRGRLQPGVGGGARPPDRVRQAVLRRPVRRRLPGAVAARRLRLHRRPPPDHGRRRRRLVRLAEAVVERDQPLPVPHVLVGGHRRHPGAGPLPAGRHLQRRDVAAAAVPQRPGAPLHLPVRPRRRRGRPHPGDARGGPPGQRPRRRPDRGPRTAGGLLRRRRGRPGAAAGVGRRPVPGEAPGHLHQPGRHQARQPQGGGGPAGGRAVDGRSVM